MEERIDVQNIFVGKRQKKGHIDEVTSTQNLQKYEYDMKVHWIQVIQNRMQYWRLGGK